MRFQVQHLVSALLLGTSCKSSAPAADAGTAPAASSTGNASSATTGSSSAAVAGQSAADALRAHPELLLKLPDGWRERVAAVAKGDANDDACPGLADLHPKDEFERRDLSAKALAACSADNISALRFAMVCPQSASFKADLGTYDFDTHSLHLAARGEAVRNLRVTNAGRVYMRAEGILLAWAGTYPSSKAPTSRGLSVAAACSGPVQDGLSALAGFDIDLPLPEAEAKTLRDQVGQVTDLQVEAAYLLDGGAAQDDLPCDSHNPKAATGRVLAWRLISVALGRQRPVSDWRGTSGWTPPPSCDEARKFFRISAEAEPAQAGGCVCDTLPLWKTALDAVPAKTHASTDENDFKCEPWMGYDDLDAAAIARMRARFDQVGHDLDALSAAIAAAPDCKDEADVRKRMVATLVELQGARKIWAPVLQKDAPTLADMSRANGPTCGAVARVRATMSRYCEGRSCAFGCPQL